MILFKTNSLKKLASIGLTANILDWYDFAVYGYLSTVIGELFFQTENKTVAFLKALLIFSIGFLVRPLGSIFFGYVADQYGRKIVLKITILLTALPTFFIGLLPTYNNWGIFSLILLIILRIIQGFAIGGELPTSACYIYEAAPEFKKNFFCSFIASGSASGVFLGSVIVLILHSLFSENQILNFAWRIPFLLSGITAIILFKLRNAITETADFKLKSDTLKKIDILKLLSQQKINIFKIFLLTAFNETAFYLLFVWFPLYLKVFLDIPSKTAYFSGTFGLLSLILLQLLVGRIARDYHRKYWFISGIVILLITAYPLFYLIIFHKNIGFILTAQFIFSIGLGSIGGVLYATLSSLINPKVRCTAVNLGFTVSNAIFGGLSPTICSFLIYKLHFNLAPVLFLLIVGVIALFAVRNL